MESRPRILGLTASLLNSPCKTPAELKGRLSELQVRVTTKCTIRKKPQTAAMENTHLPNNVNRSRL